MGIEPTCSAWKADILPLNYTRIAFQQIILYHSVFELSIAKFKKSRIAQKNESRYLLKVQNHDLHIKVETKLIIGRYILCSVTKL